MKKIILLLLFLLNTGNIICQTKETDSSYKNKVNKNFTGHVNETGVNAGKVITEKLKKVDQKVNSVETPEGWDELLREADSSIKKEKFEMQSNKLKTKTIKAKDKSYSKVLIILSVILLILITMYYIKNKNQDELGKISEIIGKLIFYSIITIISIAGIVMSLSKLEDKPGIITTLLVLLGSIIAILVFYFIIKILLRPIYNFNKKIKLKRNDELTQKEFKKHWLISLICSLLFGLIFTIGTFGISFLLMTPHYLLLKKSKNL